MNEVETNTIIENETTRVTSLTIVPNPDNKFQSIQILEDAVWEFVNNTNNALNVFTDVSNSFNRIVIEDL